MFQLQRCLQLHAFLGPPYSRCFYHLERVMHLPKELAGALSVLA